MTKDKINILIPDFSFYREIFLNKDLAKLGDNFVNFIYSLARTISAEEVSGQKVAGKVLKKAIKNSNLSEFLPSRMTAHDMADAVEALIVYTWLKEKLTLNEMIEILTREMELCNFKRRRTEFNYATVAFTKLLNEIEKRNVFK
ncbi:MAG: hypothetical protein GF329_04440 [Candidatus Lokiarchaeota archaeon]|nr:hypothetical protein [Candidatus Lokiarchaeota archaeon]